MTWRILLWYFLTNAPVCFFNEHLAEQSDTPIWSPAYVSISELFRSLSTWEVGDPVKLVCELYKVFLHETQSKETLDDFFLGGDAYQ